MFFLSIHLFYSLILTHFIGEYIGENTHTNDDVISSLRDEDNNEIEIEVEFSATGAASTTYFYVLTDQQLNIRPNREFRDIAVKPQTPILSTMSS